jgi:precorrin-2 dehydrogenase/sirohydrochlorin ferrochelatase
LLRKRLAYLDEAKAQRVVVFSEQPSDALRQAAGDRLVEKLPGVSDMRDYPLIMIAGFERRQAEILAASGRALGKLVNVEDINDLCDFYFTANVRRGDLVIAVSTSGASPTLARKIRDAIAVRFGEEWAGRVREMFELRKSWKAKGAGMQEVLENTERHLVEQGWLDDKGKAA